VQPEIKELLMSIKQSKYEIVRRSIEFDFPQRIPVRSHSHREAGQEPQHESDTFDIHSLDTDTVGWELGTEGVDEWGCEWQQPKHKDVVNMGHVAFHPLIQWKDFETYVFPDPDAESRFTQIEESLRQAGDRYVLVYKHNLLFERMWFLRGMGNLMQDFLLEPIKVNALADRVLEFDVRLIGNLSKRFKGRIHGFWTTDDWGTQSGLMISCSMWREFFKERYRKIFDEIHSAGMHVWFHSCGKINQIIEEIISIGADVINTFQPSLLGIEEVGSKFAGRVCFETCADIQKTLPFGSDEDVRDEVKTLVKKWHSPSGGLIICDYGEGKMIGVPNEKKQVLFNALQEFESPLTV
jgi:uroporphyrinogen decarboxylase